MHAYQVDQNVQKNIFILTFILAIASEYLFDLFIKKFSIPIPWWVESPSIFLFFAFYLWLYNNYFWEKWPFNKLSWFKIPNINGDWNVEIKSSFAGFDKPISGKAKIRQTASKICISLETSQSKSSSTSGILINDVGSNDYELTYNFLNQPKAESTETMNIHRGTSILNFSENPNKLEGDYFSGRGRQQFGRIILKRIT
jgi:hypothetical protein